MTQKLTIAAVLVLLPVAGLAQEHKRSEFSLGYTDLSASSDGDSLSLSMRSDWQISGAFGLQGNLAYQDPESSLSNSVIGLHGYYEFGQGSRVGVFAQQETLSITSAIGSGKFTTVGLEAMLMLSPAASLELYVGSTDIADLPIPITGATSYGAEASYAFSPSLRGRISYDVDDLEAVVPVGTFSQMGLGIDYFLTGSVPLILTAEATRVNDIFGSNSIDAFTLQVTIPIGGEPGSAGRRLFGDRNLGETFATFGG